MENPDSGRVTCLSCGAIGPAGVRFCPFCGKPFGSTGYAQGATQPPASPPGAPVAPAAPAPTVYAAPPAPVWNPYYAPPLRRRSRRPVIAGVGGVALVLCVVVAGGAFLITRPSASPSPTLAAAGGQESPSPVLSPSGTAAPSPSAEPWTFDNSLSQMTRLRAITAAGSGLVGVVTNWGKSSADSALADVFTAAGYTPADFRIDDIQTGVSDEVAAAQADIDRGAKVLVAFDGSPAAGQQFQALAAQHGIPIVGGALPAFKGSTAYYAGYDSIGTGTMMGDEFKKCVTEWGVKSPKVYELDGGTDIDYNANWFAQGYNMSIWGQDKMPLSPGVTNSEGMTLVAEQYAPGWLPDKGGTIFGQELAAQPQINATLEANDSLANAVIGVLKSKGIAARTVPTLGQDANSVDTMVNILQGYQCGTVYKPGSPFFQVSVAVATFLRAGQKPPTGLINGSIADPANPSVTIPAALINSEIWVDASNMEATVIKDGVVSATDICAAVGASVCAAAGITP
jgi:D-xylose transport system substrate-binding protein